jgi:hypothetical protein
MNATQTTTIDETELTKRQLLGQTNSQPAEQTTQFK